MTRSPSLSTIWHVTPENLGPAISEGDPCGLMGHSLGHRASLWGLQAKSHARQLLCSIEGDPFGPVGYFYGNWAHG
jgi:hypothetical protein